MPIYEYECQACGETCELVQKFNDPVATECPTCKADELKKLVSAASFHLKGGGWYVTDFKDKPKQAESQKTEKKEDKTDKKTDNKDTTTTTKAKDSKKSEQSK